jgi:hypothetical protein
MRNLKMVREFLVFCFVAAALGGTAAERLTFAERGKPSEYDIAIPVDAAPSVCYAADELQKYIFEMTRVKLPIVTNEAPRRAVVLRLEPSPEEYDWFRLKAESDNLVVSGNERGVLYGVYEILETYGGCGWFSSTTEVVPEADLFGVPGDLDRFEKAAFVSRDASWHDVVYNPEFAAKLRLSGPHMSRLDSRFGGVPFLYDPEFYSSHSFRKLLPAEKYFKDHPEYFCERDGFRETYQPCLSNPDARRIMKEGLLACIARHYPKYKYYSVSQNDNSYPCTCADCKALDEREGSQAASVLDFVNEAADAVKEKYPDVVLHTLAYMHTVKAPKTIKARDNVMIVLCTDQCDHGRPIDKSRNGNNAVFVRELAKWRQASKRIKIWDYTADFTCFMLAHPNLKSLRPNFSHFRANGATDILAQGSHEGPHFDLAELRTWLIGKLLWNPDQPVKPLVERFCRGYYGAAAPQAKKYIALMHSYDVDERVRPLHMWGNPFSEFVPASFYDEAAKIWADAAELVADDPVRARNVRWASVPVDWCRVFYSNFGAVAEVTRHPEYVDTPRFKELQAAARNVAALYRENPKSADIAEVRTFVRQMRRRIDHFSALDPKSVKAADRVQLEETFAVVVQRPGVTTVMSVDDPLAGDGKAYRIEPVPNGHVECMMNDVHVDSDGRYKIRARVRVDRVPGVDGEAFFGGVYDSSKTFRPKVIIRKGYKAGDLQTDGYAWYDLTDAWTPTPTQTVRLSIGDWDRKAANRNPAVHALYVDAFEIVRVD